MTRKKLSPIERFESLTDAQKDAAVAKYEQALPLGRDGLPGKPLTKRDKALHRRAARKGSVKTGRPKVGAGSTVVPVSIERGLLRKADAYARRRGLKRSQMFASGLRLMMDQRAA